MTRIEDYANEKNIIRATNMEFQWWRDRGLPITCHRLEVMRYSETLEDKNAAQRQEIEQLQGRVQALEGAEAALKNLLNAWKMDRGQSDKEKMNAWIDAMSKALKQAHAALAATGEEGKAQP